MAPGLGWWRRHDSASARRLERRRDDSEWREQRKKGTIINRITWTPLPEGKVKQEWASSTNTGATWQISFVGIYEKQP